MWPRVRLKSCEKKRRRSSSFGSALYYSTGQGLFEIGILSLKANRCLPE